MRKPVCRHDSTGFTLLEVMLVLLLIGILASAVVMSFSSDSREEQLQQETEQFQQVFQFVAEQAMMKQQEWGLYTEPSGYAFMYYDGEKWHLAAEPKSLRRTLPDNIRLQLELDGLPGAETNLLSKLEWEQGDDEQQQDEKTPVLPKVFILSSGEISPFKLIFVENSELSPLYSAVSTDFTVPLLRYDVSSDLP